MARELRIYERPSTLERPVLIGAFRGWNDGGQAATLAAGYLARLWGARKFADIDPELFVDFQATRPMVSLEEGRTRKIEWPENTFFRARIPGAGRDAIILVGVEPNYRWRSFSEIVTDLAAELGVELAVTLGALVADVPTRGPRRSPVQPPIRNSSTSSGSSSRGTKGRRGSWECSSTRAAAPESRP